MGYYVLAHRAIPGNVTGWGITKHNFIMMFEQE
jgi:hypothetical protein